MRHLTMLFSAVGALLCLATAGTGVYFGMMGHPEVKGLHLNLAMGCVFVSLVAHMLSLQALAKHKG